MLFHCIVSVMEYFCSCISQHGAMKIYTILLSQGENCSWIKMEETRMIFLFWSSRHTWLRAANGATPTCDLQLCCDGPGDDFRSVGILTGDDIIRWLLLTRYVWMTRIKNYSSFKSTQMNESFHSLKMEDLLKLCYSIFVL